MAMKTWEGVEAWVRGNLPHEGYEPQMIESMLAKGRATMLLAQEAGGPPELAVLYLAAELAGIEFGVPSFIFSEELIPADRLGVIKSDNAGKSSSGRK
jgi:hypothetical protein